MRCDGTASSAQVTAGLDWVAQNMQYPAVVSMSLGSNSPNAAIDTAVSTVIALGVTVVVAAGNYNQGGPLHVMRSCAALRCAVLCCAVLLQPGLVLQQLLSPYLDKAAFSCPVQMRNNTLPNALELYETTTFNGVGPQSMHRACQSTMVAMQLAASEHL